MIYDPRFFRDGFFETPVDAAVAFAKRAAKEAGWPRAPLHARRVDGVTTAARDLAFPGRGGAGLAQHAALAAALAVDGAMRRDAADARATQAWALATRRDCPDYGFLGDAWAAARAAAATHDALLGSGSSGSVSSPP